MKVFAISDLHLPGGDAKPMEVFGRHWENHFARLSEDWRSRVLPDDLVLIPGDISWAMYLEQAMDDLRAIAALPGRKVILRGNHDYWWGAIGRVRAALPAGMAALQNDAIRYDDVIVCGARGWLCPGSAQMTPEDEKIYLRELARLELSLQDAEKKSRGASARLIAMLHFPPFADRAQPTEVTRLLTRYGVKDAVYGHLHGAGLQGAFEGEMDGVKYHQVSCDGLKFALRQVWEDARGFAPGPHQGD